MALCSSVFGVSNPNGACHKSLNHLAPDGVSLAGKKSFCSRREVHGRWRQRELLCKNLCRRQPSAKMTSLRWNSSSFVELRRKSFQTLCSLPYSTGPPHDIFFDGLVMEKQLEDSATSGCEEIGREDAHFICVDKQAIEADDWRNAGISEQYSQEFLSNSVTEIQKNPESLREEGKILEEAESCTKTARASSTYIASLTKQAYKFLMRRDETWAVPWKAETIIQVMLLWIASFWFVGSWIIPFSAFLVGFHKDTLTYRGQALYSLLTDVTEGLAGIAILRRCLAKFDPLPSGWFHFSIRGSWYLDVFMGCLLFPLVHRLSQINLDLVPAFPAPTVSVSSVEQSIVARDPVAMALYAVVVSVCAPIWEEIVFRGFLLPSLTKYMPLWCSVVVSAVAFALAHFNAQRLLPLVFLGVIMGTVFARSRNLFASMLLHSLWNGFVFLDLMR